MADLAVASAACHLNLSGMLDLIAGALRAEGIPFVRIDGKSSAKARKEAIQAFAGVLKRSWGVTLCYLSVSLL
jgi:hypothetical protein